MMRSILKAIVGNTLKPFLEHYYLKKRRAVRFGALSLQVEPGVFHPGLFFSSKYISRYLQQLPLDGMRVLDMGCGSGLISLAVAAEGAQVTSVDINESAVCNTRRNAELNGLRVDARVSDLFEQLDDDRFDLIVVNPPYYPKNPSSVPERAWFCGTQFQYFTALFADAPAHLSAEATLYMVLSDDCDLERISEIAADSGFRVETVDTCDFLIEYNYILRFKV